LFLIVGEALNKTIKHELYQGKIKNIFIKSSCNTQMILLLPLDVIDNPSLPLVETLKSFGEASSLVIN
jgi:hypothetical protein